MFYIYHSNVRKHIQVKTPPPLFQIRINNPLYRLNLPVINDQPIQPTPRRQSQINSLLTQAQVPQIPSQNLDAPRTSLFLQAFEALPTPCDDYEVARLWVLEEEARDCEADASGRTGDNDHAGRH